MEVRLKGLERFRQLSVSLSIAAMVIAGPAAAQANDPVIKIELPIGRAYPLTTSVAITKVSLANPEVADVVVVGTRELVINAKGNGETDAIFWLANGSRQHYRISVHAPADRQQIALYIKIAEVRKDLLRNTGLSGVYRNKGTRIGTGTLNTDNVFGSTGKITLPNDAGFGTVLTDFGTKNLLALLDVEEQSGRARTLAEPNIIAGNKDTATFLAGGEIPVPIVQPSSNGGQSQLSIQYKEFGVRLKFSGEILNDSLIKLYVRPEVSSLDFTNGIQISGFLIPAFRTRRVETTIDVRRDQSMIISGLFNNERELINRGIPYLKDIPIIGELFSSKQWKDNESELLVVVTPVIIDPTDPRPQDVLRLLPDTALPAREAIKKRLDDTNKRPPSPIIR
ncbi:MAG: pilus assembly protein N-terminal domain-containing protein [Gemmatimonadaceae bacterium]